MRFLYYCNSSYQLLNAINLHYNRRFNSFENIDNYEGDVLLLDVFSGAKEISDILIENKIFDKIFIGKRVYKQGKFHLIKNIIDIVKPSQFIYKANGIKKEEIYDKYDCLVVPKFSTITAAIWKMNRNAKLHLYEDGIGAYHGFSLNPNSKSYQLLYKIFNYGRTFNDYEYYYLNNPSLYVGEEINRIKQMPKFDSNTLSSLESIFKEFSFNIKNDKKIIWFDQFVNDDINNITRQLLGNYKKDVVYCTHPRHQKNYEEFDKPNSKQIWELACLGLNDINDKCLLTIHSTAVFTPKLLYDFEPYVIFTVKLLSSYKEGKQESIDKLKVINEFKKMYKDQSKILIPNDIDELKGIIGNFINK